MDKSVGSDPPGQIPIRPLRGDDSIAANCTTSNGVKCYVASGIVVDNAPLKSHADIWRVKCTL